MKATRAVGIGPILSDPHFAELKKRLIEATGLHYYADKEAALAKHIGQRLAVLGLSGCGGYLRLLRDGREGERELDLLVKTLTIGETHFFRHPALFEALKKTALPDILRRNRESRQLRIWSAGCSNGSEAYTVSILLRRDLRRELEGWNISIVGTDINRAFLARAEEGAFTRWAFRSTPEDVVNACFIRDGRRWRIRPEYRQGVSFQYHNLVTGRYPSLLDNLFALDLILCRNVMIYFDEETNRRIVSKLRECLVEGGWLLVGPGELNPLLYSSFRVHHVPDAVFFQKPPREDPFDLPAPLAPERPGGECTPAAPTVSEGTPCSTAARAEAVPPSGDRTARSGQQPGAPEAPELDPLEAIRREMDRGCWKEAQSRCRTLLETDPLNPRAHFHLGLILEQEGRLEEAHASLKRAIYLERKFVAAHYHRGILSLRRGCPSEAARSFRAVLELLQDRAEDEIPGGAGPTTAGELRELATMQLELLAAGPAPMRGGRPAAARMPPTQGAGSKTP